MTQSSETKPGSPKTPDRDLAALAAWSDAQRSAGCRIVFTNGCFDLLHVGHLRYLQAARALGDRLFIALNDDASTRRLKGPGRPILPCAERQELLLGLSCVDQVIAFAEDRASRLLEACKPEVYVKGGDYAEPGREPPEAALARRLGAELRYLPFVEGRSTSTLIDRIKAGDAALGTGPVPEA